jgi:protein O-GlcNAc transferase
MMTDQEKFEKGTLLHQQGKLAEAELLYAEVIHGDPANYDALRRLGVIALSTNRTLQGVELITKAIGLNPNYAKSHLSLGYGLMNLGLPEAALKSIDKAIALAPDSALAYNNRGGALSELKRFEEALASCDKAIALEPDFAEAHINRGWALLELKRFEEALASCDKAIALEPDFAEAHSNRGAALLELKRFEEALASCDKAIALKPNYAAADSNRGRALLELKRFEEALASCDRAIALAPDFAPAFSNRGLALYGLKRFEEALASCDKAIVLKPDFAQAYTNRGAALLGLKRFEEALASCDKAIALEPDYPAAWLSSGVVYFELNRKDKAISCLERAIELDPSDSRARFGSCIAELPILYQEESEILESRRNYERKLRALCDAFELGDLKGDLARAISLPFYLAYQGYCDRNLQELYGLLVCKIMNRAYLKPTLPPPPAIDQPVRVGFVSGFFRNHSNWKIPIQGWISQLDRRRFQIFGYHVGKEWDGETAIAASMCHRFVHGLTTIENWRNEILADSPHILIYPGLLMENLTLELAAQRLAPVQCSSFGHPETSGMPTVDFYISSELMEPEEASAHYSETLVRLPNLSIYYTAPPTQVVVRKRSEFDLRSDATVFWCGQSLFKYLPQYDFVFANIAARVDNCQFLFIQHFGSPEVTNQFMKRLDRAFKLIGLDFSRYCVFSPRLNSDWFISAIGQCDLILDSIGWSGFNSSLESLECNLPIVTIQGTLMRGRHTAAILQMMGVLDTIAATIDDYVSIAVRLATNPAERTAISRSIADAKHRLYRDRSCVSALEDFLENVARHGRPCPRG